MENVVEYPCLFFVRLFRKNRAWYAKDYCFSDEKQNSLERC